MSKARIFLSCGQMTGSDEPAIARAIANRLDSECGFECYIAVDDHSPIGLRENIFQQLERADYFVFIDFIRDEFKAGEYRGSLFSHQELAIASYLEIPILPFQESGVRELDGMLGVIHGNSIRFHNRAHLPEAVISEVKEQLKKASWTTSTRNQLQISSRPSSEDHPVKVEGGDIVNVRYWSISVLNHHHRKAALQCYAYLEKLVDLGRGNEFALRTVELKWGGTPIPGVRIAPGGDRSLTVLSTFHGGGALARFIAVTDSDHYQPPSLREGTYDLTFAVASENFPTAQKRLRVEIGDRWDKVSIYAPPA